MSITREKHMELIKMAIGMPEEERMALMDSGLFNSIIEGYLVSTLQRMGMDEETVREAAYELYCSFDDVNAREAAQKAAFSR